MKNEEKLKIEVTFKCYDDYKVKMIFEDIENFKYGVNGDYIIYNTLFICENGIYTFATKENFEESEELDYFYVKCKKIEIEEKKKANEEQISSINEENEKIKIVFRNKGDAIPEYKLEKLFDKFYRADEARQSSTGGTGLGLAIAKEIIELHKGKIMAKNDGEYIEFAIELNNNID